LIKYPGSSRATARVGRQSRGGRDRHGHTGLNADKQREAKSGAAEGLKIVGFVAQEFEEGETSIRFSTDSKKAIAEPREASALDRALRKRLKAIEQGLEAGRIKL
jgi:hypothetical protein